MSAYYCSTCMHMAQVQADTITTHTYRKYETHNSCCSNLLVYKLMCKYMNILKVSSWPILCHMLQDNNVFIFTNILMNQGALFTFCTTTKYVCHTAPDISSHLVHHQGFFRFLFNLSCNFSHNNNNQLLHCFLSTSLFQ